MGKIQLYQFAPLGDQESASPFCVKVQRAMRYKRIPFQIINATSPLQVRRLNPRGKLPVMIDDGMKLADSTEIVRHLETRHPEPRLYPLEPRTRATALMLEDWADESLYWHVVYERWQISEQFSKFAKVIFSPVPAAVGRTPAEPSPNVEPERARAQPTRSSVGRAPPLDRGRRGAAAAVRGPHRPRVGPLT